MNKKAIKAMLVALLVSLVVSVILWNKIQEKQVPTNNINVPEVPIMVAKKLVIVCKKQIAARTRIEASMINLKKPNDPAAYFVLKAMNASSVPDLAFTDNDIASLTNRYTAMTIIPDDIITPKRLLDEDTGSLTVAN